MKPDPHDYMFCPVCQQGHVQLAGIAVMMPTAQAMEYVFVYHNLKPEMESNMALEVEPEKLNLDIQNGAVLFYHCRDCDFQWRQYVCNYEEDVVILSQKGSDPFAEPDEDGEEFEEEDDDEGEEWKKGQL